MTATETEPVGGGGPERLRPYEAPPRGTDHGNSSAISGPAGAAARHSVDPVTVCGAGMLPLYLLTSYEIVRRVMG